MAQDMTVDNVQLARMLVVYDKMRRETVAAHEQQGLSEDQAAWLVFRQHGFDAGAIERFVSERATAMLGLLERHFPNQTVSTEDMEGIFAALFLDGVAFGMTWAEESRDG